MSLIARRRKRPELNLVPLIDVLVMLIFFTFVTMQFKSAATLNITLPKVDTAGKNEFKGTVIVTITKEGKFTFNGKEATDAQLPELLRKVHNIDKDIPVLITADEKATLDRVAFVMDTCRKSGLNKFSLQSRGGK